MSREQLKEAREKLANQTGLSVGSAYGYPDGIKNMDSSNPEEFLIVWSDKKVKFPETFEGFRVVRRGIPRAL